MVVPEWFHRVNDWLSFALGYFFNITLLWLIAHHTTAEMANYRPLLLLSILIDLVYLAVYAVVVPVLVIDSGHAVWISVGPLGWVPQPYNYALIALWTLCCSFSVNTLAVPFIIRYLCICWRKNYGLRELLAMLFVPAAVSIGNVVVQARAGYPHTAEDQRAGLELLLLGSDNYTMHGTAVHHHHDYIIAFFARPERGGVLFLYVMVTVAVVYLLIFSCAWRIYCHLTRMAVEHMSGANYRALNLQLSSALLLQSIPPLMLVFVPAMSVHAAAFLGVSARDIAVYEIAVQAWIPVVNPLISMWVMHAYRHTVLQWLRNVKGAVSRRRSTSVHALTGGGGQSVPLRHITTATTNPPVDNRANCR